MDCSETWPQSVKSVGNILKNGKVRGKQSTLYIQIRPLAYAFRIFGLAPYEFNVNDQLVPSVKFMIFSFFWIVMHTYCIRKLFFNNIYYLNTTSDKVHPSIYLIYSMVFNYTSVVFEIIHSLIMRDKFTKIWNVLQDYDEAVEDIGHTRNESTTLIWVWSVFIFSFLGWLAINQLGIAAAGESWIQNLSFMIVYVGFSISVTKFSGIIMLLGQRFHHLNEITKKCMQNGTRWLYAGPSLDAAMIERLHNDLMIAGENLESMYSMSMIIWLGNLTAHVVHYLYVLLTSLNIPSETKRLYCVIAWGIIFIWQIVLLTTSCNFASTEANDMNSISLEWKRRLHCRYKKSVMPSLFTMLNRRLRFTAAGCFDVNLHLLSAIVGFITTFLVILLQMK